MPELDGTGPLGKGPLTGKGLGYCILRNDVKKTGRVQGYIGLKGDYYKSAKIKKPIFASNNVSGFGYGNIKFIPGGNIMPGGDRTGPAGLGPMTGRSAGYCAGYSVPGFANPMPGRGFWGRGRGFGGGGRGRGFRNMYRATGLPGWARYGGYPAWEVGTAPYAYGPPVSSEQEVEVLKNQARLMQDEMNAVNERIRELEKPVAEVGKKTAK